MLYHQSEQITRQADKLLEVCVLTMVDRFKLYFEA